MKIPDWLSALLVMFNESWLTFSLVLLVSLLVVRFIWRKIKKLSMKILALALTVPLSTGAGFTATAIEFVNTHSDKGASISEMYEKKSTELFDKKK